MQISPYTILSIFVTNIFFDNKYVKGIAVSDARKGEIISFKPTKSTKI